MRRLSICAIFLASTIAIGQNAPQQTVPDKKDCPVPGAGANEGTKVQPCPSSPTAPPSTAEKFPYPGEPSLPSPAMPKTANRAEVPEPSAPAKQFPYPGQDTSSSDSMDSSSSSGPASGTGDPAASDGGSGGSVRRRLPKPDRIQSDEDRAAEDLSVAKYYRQSGNLHAAYLRAKDAVKVQPGDPETHFALAEIAQHLNRREEAAAEYDAYLKLEPDGDQVKAAQKALALLK